jgi:hypothetical protein
MGGEGRSTMEGMFCTTCRYGTEEPHGSVFARDRGQGWGTCRKQAPAVVVIQSPERTAFSQTAFPRMRDDDWCGDYAAVSSRSGGYAGLDHP